MAQQDDTLVFVEVRTKRHLSYGTPQESLTKGKIARLIATAETYLQEHEPDVVPTGASTSSPCCWHPTERWPRCNTSPTPSRKGNVAVRARPLGTSATQIPVIGLGTSRYRGGAPPLRRGIELGAWIDTAESYGSEGIVGEAVAGQRDKVFIATKVSPGHLAYHELLKAADSSLRRLGTDYIDLYQVHFPSSRVPIAETMGAMETLVDRGKVRFIGVSNFSTAQLDEARAAMTRHPCRFQSGAL